MYTPYAKTERIAKLREAYLKSPVATETNPYVDKKYRKFCTGDRWMTLGYLRGWQKHADADTVRLRTSYAEAEELYEAKPVIIDGELLVGQPYLPEYSDEEMAEYEKLCEMFSFSAHTLKERPPRKDHLSLDFEKLLSLGLSGIKAEIKDNLARLPINSPYAYPDYDIVKKYEFYNCLLIELDALSDLAKRYSKEAERLSHNAPEPRKSELLRISEIMSHVPEYPAQSFYEALQSVQFYAGTLFGLYPLNRPDRYLYEFYKNDIENGIITKELAGELIDNFCLHITNRVFSRAACGFMVGGRNTDGTVCENELTYMFLTALDHIRLPDPNGALAVCHDTSDEILRYSIEVLSNGVTHPAFYNDDAIVKSLVENYGVDKNDAVDYIHTCCAEITVSGKTRGHTTPFRIDLPRLLVEIANENTSCSSMTELLDKYTKCIERKLHESMLSYALRMLEASRIGNEPMRVCALVDDCIARGMSIFEGGERYTFIQPVLIGFSTATDSLIAIRELVYNEKKLSLKEFCDIVSDDFEKHESLREYIINKLPHYGNDDDRADGIAADLAERIKGIFKDNQILFGKNLMPGTFSYVDHAGIGSRMGTTFDGRLKGYSYSDGCSPVQGRDTNGPTAMVNSLTSWKQSELLGGMVVNIKFGTNNLTSDKADNFIGILRTFFERGGIEMQVNVIDRKTLIEASEHPELHGDLVVRIGGYSDYFVRLSKTLRQEIIDRTEY